MSDAAAKSSSSEAALNNSRRDTVIALNAVARSLDRRTLTQNRPWCSVGFRFELGKVRGAQHAAFAAGRQATKSVKKSLRY